MARIVRELADAEEELAASFDRSTIKAVHFQHNYVNHTVAMVDGLLRVIPAGSPFELADPGLVDPSLSAVEVEAAAHEASKTFAEETGTDMYDALRVTL